MNTAIIIPAYNPPKSFLQLIPAIHTITSTPVIIVDDGSEPLIILASSNCTFLRNKKNMGKGYAIKKGVLASKYEWIITCDLDMSVLPDQFLIWKKKKFINNNKYAYFGSRENKNSVVQALFIRRIVGFILHLFVLALFNVKISDTQCGFKVFHSNYIKKIFKKIKMKGYVYDVEVALALKKRGIQIVELTLTWIHKEGSKVNLISDSVRFFFDLIILKIRY